MLLSVVIPQRAFLRHYKPTNLSKRKVSKQISTNNLIKQNIKSNDRYGRHQNGFSTF